MKKMNLTNIFPSVIANLVLDYYDPCRVIHRKKQGQINRAFDQARKTNQHDIITIDLNIGWEQFTEKEKNSYMYPSVSRINEDIKTYEKDRKNINEYLRIFKLNHYI
jgi:hypothetical protein